MRIALLLLGSLIASQFLTAQTISDKIDARLRTRLADGQPAEMLIVLRQQPDLRGAEQFKRKEDKGWFVYQTCSDLAERTQTGVRDLLRDANVPAQSFWIINAVWAKGDLTLAQTLAALPEVARIDDNPVFHLDRYEQAEQEVLVEDRLTPRNWGLTTINADDVWNGMASNSTPYKGANIIIGGQDTGYEWNHPALKSKYRGWNGASADHNYNWHDAIHSLIGGGANSCGLNLMAPCDDNGHGTHTMGTMLGGPNNDSVYGVAPEAKWMSCRNMEEGDGTPTTYIECFQWFLAPTNLANNTPDPSKAPHVINNSWGCPTSEGCNSSNFSTMEAAVTALRNAGIVVVVSAGNDGSACSTINSPAAIFDNSYTVGATGSTDNIASFSSRGPVTVDGSNRKKPDISAPGVSIPSCIGTDNNTGTYGYTNLSGTSMAGPHVAGLVALVRNARPDITSVQAIEDLINNSAVPKYTTQGCGGDLSTTRPNNVFGYGRIDALAAVNAALSLPVELLFVKATPNSRTVAVTWGTVAESHCSHFEVERSFNAFQWEKIGSVNCANRLEGSDDYLFNDEQPYSGVSYYRLKQVDDTGASRYSPIAMVRRNGSLVELSAVPRVSANSIWVDLGGIEPGASWQFQLHSADGKLVQQWPCSQTGLIALPRIAKGIYLISVADEKGNTIAREKINWF